MSTTACIMSYDTNVQHLSIQARLKYGLQLGTATWECQSIFVVVCFFLLLYLVWGLFGGTCREGRRLHPKCGVSTEFRRVAPYSQRDEKTRGTLERSRDVPREFINLLNKADTAPRRRIYALAAKADFNCLRRGVTALACRTVGMS